MNKTNSFLKDNYHILIPLAVTLALYAISLTYGFRNFDEDIIIKDFFTNKTLGEYVEKYFLVGLSGITEAHGFTFSSIKNVHFCLLERPLFYLVHFLFQSKPFLFHLLGLLLHMLTICLFTKMCFHLTQNKQIALFSALIWAIHPTNVESVIWATNWPAILGAFLYFYTLNKVAIFVSKEQTRKGFLIFITFITLIQILIVEHTITIPVAIFLTALYFQKKNNFLDALKLSISSFLAVFAYIILRIIFIEKTTSVNNLSNLMERIIFFTPQTFFHELKLVLFPTTLTIDQIDHLNIDATFGKYYLLCVITMVLTSLIIFFSRKKFPYLSYGLLLYVIGIAPFLQIIPLYSLVAERYNYFGSAFLIFGIVATLFNLRRADTRVCPYIAILCIICLLLGSRSYLRIFDWKDSQTLFSSTINTSKSLLKKGIWTYNLALSSQDKKEELLNTSTNLLDFFIKTYDKKEEPTILQKYELDSKSLLSKAALRISTNYEILNKRKPQLEYLNKALLFSRAETQIQSLIYKNLGTFYFQENDITKATDYYKKSYAISPNPTINYAIAVCYLKLNDYVNYENYLKKAVSVISPYNISPFKTYGQFLELSKNNYEDAIKYYKIAALLENNPEPYILLSTLYLKLQQADNALKYTKRGLHSFPENPTLIYYKDVLK